MDHFHPAVRAWFDATFDSPTPPQLEAWEAIDQGHHALVSAPTGSGKTFAAFLKAIDGLIKQAAQGILEQKVSVVYVSPLKALSNDIQINLEAPLSGIHQHLLESGSVFGLGPQKVEAAVRTGDTPQWERTKMLKNPPHILVTTPESLYILLTSESGRNMLSSTNTLIIDEIHAVVGNKRGAHLALSMERLERLCATPLLRIGLSATQDPIERVAEFLVGHRDSNKDCRIIDSGHQRKRDLGLCLPESPLEAVMAGEVWSEIYAQLEELIESHNTTLIFVNTRRLAERLSKALAERLGDEAVTSHHGSLAKEHRFSAEQKLKSGKIKALVATASLELGIDIGDVDLVCQIGSPRAVSVMLQRVGRSGHGLGRTPKGRLFPLSRDDLVECIAVIDSINRGELDQLKIYPAPLDVLAQQIVAESAAGELLLDDLFNLVTRTASYRSLARDQFDEVIKMLADGFSTQRGRRSAHIHLDAVNGKIRPRKGARLTAITNGGTIPDQFDYDVILQPDNLKIGTLNEDFSFESLPGDVFQLGNTSYMILRVELGKVFVRDAKGQPPNIPFWFGEAPGRTDAVSSAVSRLRKNVQTWMEETEVDSRGRFDHVKSCLIETYNLTQPAAEQVVQYLGSAYSALGALPSQDTIIFERFFDEAGDQHLVIHSSFGSRLNRGWGLALRKRFCRKFNFELQAAALEDSIVLSLGSTHSFPLEEPSRYLKTETVKEVLTQALLDAPMFPTHWRWNASISLAIRRFSNGKKTPPQFQRSNAEDLVAVIFPDQIACAENIAGKREIPDHPLVEQTLYDCLHDLMDIEGLKVLLTKLEAGEMRLVCKDLTSPSPLSEEILTAKPYAFLDDAPAEERRTSLVRTRQFLHPEDAAVLDKLDQSVIDEVRKEAWPTADSVDECHDALLIMGGVSVQEATDNNWIKFLEVLNSEKRAFSIRIESREYWIAAERLSYWKELHPTLCCELSSDVNEYTQSNLGWDVVLMELIRMRLQGVGPILQSAMAEFFNLEIEDVAVACSALEIEGYAMRGEFDPRMIDSLQAIQQIAEEDVQVDVQADFQWCERGLLARIHKRSIGNLRKQIQPVSISRFMSFLFQWQGLDEDSSNAGGDPDQLASIIEQLEGLEMPAAAWEESIFSARLKSYMPYWLDILCSSGRVTWTRLSTSKPVISGSASTRSTARGSNRQSPIAFASRHGMRHWLMFAKRHEDVMANLSAMSVNILKILESRGALFYEDLRTYGQGLGAEIEQGLSELVAVGLVSSDNFDGLRSLTKTNTVSQSYRTRSRKSSSGNTAMSKAGRWSVVGSQSEEEREVDDLHLSDYAGKKWESVEYIAEVLLRRYGIVFRKLLELEKNLPSWRDLQYVFRRMEARGEIRGGRFVNGFAGEQFALPEAVGLIRSAEKHSNGELISISAADPLNLTGAILPGNRVPSVRKNRLLFRNGKLLARFVGGEVFWEESLSSDEQWQAKQKLIRIPKTNLGKYRHNMSRSIH